VNALASILAAVYVASEFALSIVKRARSGKSRLADRGSLALLWIVISCSMFLAFSQKHETPQFDFRTLAVPATAMGVVVFVAGLAIRWYAIIYLGRFFTVNVAIASDHELIDGGPYRYVRHPSYSGALLAFFGLGLCIGNWVSIAIIAIPILAVFLWRIHVEEAALLRGLGNQYQSYMDRTKRLIPGVY
jgi:protein-S-isoprenylcysteine O-methyltransferase